MRLSSSREKAVREVSNEKEKNDPNMGALFTALPLAEVEPRASHIIIDLKYFK